MGYHYDWLMSQIESITAMLAFILFGKRESTLIMDHKSDPGTGKNELSLTLQFLAMQGRICEAEDMLFEALENPDRAVLEAAAAFYSRLQRMTDQELESHNFSREEILDGLREVCKAYGIPT